MAGGITHGRESGFASAPTTKTKKQMDSGFRRNDVAGGFRRNEKKELDPGLSRDDEAGGLRRNDEIGRDRGVHTKHEHHPHPTLPLKGRAKELDPGLRQDDEVERLSQKTRFRRK
jgi:hypothetical protein